MKLTSKAKLEVNIMFTVTEEEAKALSALSHHGRESFLKKVEDALGPSNYPAVANGLHSFFNTIDTQLQTHLNAAKKAREVYDSEILARAGERHQS